MSKHWFALSGPAGTGKTTLMYEVVACLRELGIEAVGVTERVRLFPRLTHKELMESRESHVSLFAAQWAMEQELGSRDETEVIILDRCLLDYVVLAEQSFPSIGKGPDWEDVAKKATGVSMSAYCARFDAIIVPNMLELSPLHRKIRPDDDFRAETAARFTRDRIAYLTGATDVTYLHDGIPLRDRCAEVTDDIILSKMGRSDVFRNGYLLQEIAAALRSIAIDGGETIDKIWVSGSRCSLSPTFPAYGSDVDLFVSVTGKKDVVRDEVGSYGNFVSIAEHLLRRLFGVTVNITHVNEKLADMVRLKEIIE